MDEVIYQQRLLERQNKNELASTKNLKNLECNGIVILPRIHLFSEKNKKKLSEDDNKLKKKLQCFLFFISFSFTKIDTNFIKI